MPKKPGTQVSPSLSDTDPVLECSSYSDFICHWQNVRNFGPIFEQNVTINFEPIFKQNANFDPIFEKSVYFGPIFEKV